MAVLLTNCQNLNKKNKVQASIFTESAPNGTPLQFRPELTPDDHLIHRGVFSPDLDKYYYTLSDKNFKQFDIKYIQKEGNEWSSPKDAVINSEFNDHGMSFSPDGKHLYFSSTRPVDILNVPNTWHLWKSSKIDNRWTEPTFVDIPNLRDRLVSHPTVSSSGELYFHVSNLDYSEMDIYSSKNLNGVFQDAIKVPIAMEKKAYRCTPYVSPDHGYLIFAVVGEQLELMISFRNNEGKWTPALSLDRAVNHNGQGNPSVTPDGKYLFFATGTRSQPNEKADWVINWIDMESVLIKVGLSIVNQGKVSNG